MRSTSNTLEICRFAEDSRRVEAITNDEAIRSMLPPGAAEAAQASARKHLLSSAVRVDPRYLPDLARSFERIRERAGLDQPLEAYVYSDSEVQACVMEGAAHTLVVLSSGAVKDLSSEELEFIIGHEIGHALHGHTSVGVNQLLQTGQVTNDQAMDLFAWQRAAEITADRTGLICCGSLEVASNALFKTLSGLGSVALDVAPSVFAEQWDHLVDEVFDHGESEHAHYTHPFPPLRMRAMQQFWDKWEECNCVAESDIRRHIDDVDADISRLLSFMSVDDSDDTDTFLSRFILWGGLHVASASGEPRHVQLTKIETLVGRSPADSLGEDYVARFRETKDARRKKLSALEIHTIIESLVSVAACTGSVDQKESAAINGIAGILGVSESAVQMIISNTVAGRAAA